MAGLFTQSKYQSFQSTNTIISQNHGYITENYRVYGYQEAIAENRTDKRSDYRKSVQSLCFLAKTIPSPYNNDTAKTPSRRTTPSNTCRNPSQKKEENESTYPIDSAFKMWMTRVANVWADGRPKLNWITQDISEITESNGTFPDTSAQKRSIFCPVLVKRPFLSMDYILQSRCHL